MQVACSHKVLLDKKGMKHILERHHPLFHNGTIRATHSFFPKNTSVCDIENAIFEVLSQNQAAIDRIGMRSIGTMFGTVNGVRYQLGLNFGKVGQFFPIAE